MRMGRTRCFGARGDDSGTEYGHRAFTVARGDGNGHQHGCWAVSVLCGPFRVLSGLLVAVSGVNRAGGGLLWPETATAAQLWPQKSPLQATIGHLKRADTSGKAEPFKIRLVNPSPIQGQSPVLSLSFFGRVFQERIKNRECGPFSGILAVFFPFFFRS